MSSHDPLLALLSAGALELKGQFAWGSNYTFLVQVSAGDQVVPAVYKPARGERPLWDFPDGSLAQREVAAYVVSRALGWDLVPPTVLRPDGPAGPGSLQLFVDADPERHYFTFSNEEKQRLRPAAAFDMLVNNADRKAGHVLLGDARSPVADRPWRVLSRRRQAADRDLGLHRRGHSRGSARRTSGRSAGRWFTTLRCRRSLEDSCCPRSSLHCAREPIG